MKTNRILLAVCVMCAAGAVTPRAMHAAALPPMLPKDYDQLNQKSIFSKNRRTSNPYGNGRVIDRTPPKPRTYLPVFIGTMAEDAGYFVAFIQDPGSGRMLSFAEGDLLPNDAGTIKDIALDYIEVSSVTAGGPDKKIMVGQNILGGAAEYPSSDNQMSSPPSMPGPGSNGPGGSPPNMTTNVPAAPSDGSTDDLITRLRKRRQAQVGG